MFQFAIDRGGTFTDVWARCPNGKCRVLKLLSEDPANYPDAPREGIRRILEEETGIPHPRSERISTERIEWIRMGTTLATNALLERKGARMALAVSCGFRDLLHIGNQSRSSLFDLSCRMPSLLYEEVIEVEERVVLQQDECQLREKLGRQVHSEVTGEPMQVSVELNETRLREQLQAVRQRGISSLAVLLVHSYLYDAHERRVGEIARELGFEQVSLSSHVMRMQRAVPRGLTACADAYLTPCIANYVRHFLDGFHTPAGAGPFSVQFMQSDGGLADAESFLGSRAILSGPAGGVVGYASVTRRYTDLPIIGFDMGGTSTDVSRFAGAYEHVFETTLAGVTIQSPQLDVNTVAAGGGSILSFRAGLFRVGPESAGAHPGPACYRKGGPLTVTDANLLLGRLVPECFPAIFGPHENEPLDCAASRALFEPLAAEINAFNQAETERFNNELRARAAEIPSDPQPRMREYKPLSVEEVAMGFVRVANESMCRPIRALTQARGFDTSRHVLAIFGGAGAQHACSIARTLGVRTVYVHRFAGALSAVGIALADCVAELQAPSALRFSPDNQPQLTAIAQQLCTEARNKLRQQGFEDARIETEIFLNMRYDGTDTSIMISEFRDDTVHMQLENTASARAPGVSRERHGDFESAFLARYRVEYGFTLSDRAIFIDDVRVRGIGRSAADSVLEERVAARKQDEPLRQQMSVRCYFETAGWLDTPVYTLRALCAGDALRGPSIIVDSTNTILVEPDCTAVLTEFGDLRIDVEPRALNEADVGTGQEPDPIYLSIFSHRFMSIAEQAGRVLQRTAISTNIKERLDFSCALFGPDGCLVANAPHIPVHLGAMQEAVQYQITTRGDSMRDGDVLLSNHPQAGGSHLPDLTVITPCFYPGQSAPVFFVASRGHHADIGGLTPGSMPPHSRTIHEEGAVFTSFLLVRGGELQEAAVRDVLVTAGTRRLHDNLSDLRAQVAANQKAIHLLKELITEYSLPVVQGYMKHIQENAELAVREMLRDVATRLRKRYAEMDVRSTQDCGLLADDGRVLQVRARDLMDDGAQIVLHLRIDSVAGSAEFDFRGTSCELYSNLNAPRAVTYSAIIYCLRCIVGYDVPLNQGCLAPIRIHIPRGSMLDPHPEAAVVGGNVLTSQRLVDVVLRAFEVCAASQGCMNNITFGNDRFGYYETVAGGAGAGPSWHGRSGVHVHMTNTRITDVEVLERRYPVLVRRFRLLNASGGDGRFRGGDGVLRELLFREPITLSVLTERRSHKPYGLHGGLPGRTGLNLLIRNAPDPLHDVDADSIAQREAERARVINLGSKCSVECLPGDIFRLETPGGGGYGDPQSKASDSTTDGSKVTVAEVAFKGSLYDYKLMQEST